MMLNFPVNQRLFYAMATADIAPLTWALNGWFRVGSADNALQRTEPDEIISGR